MSETTGEMCDVILKYTRQIKEELLRNATTGGTNAAPTLVLLTELQQYAGVQLRRDEKFLSFVRTVIGEWGKQDLIELIMDSDTVDDFFDGYVEALGDVEQYIDHGGSIQGGDRLIVNKKVEAMIDEDPRQRHAGMS